MSGMASSWYNSTILARYASIIHSSGQYSKDASAKRELDTACADVNSDTFSPSSFVNSRINVSLGLIPSCANAQIVFVKP